MPLSLSFPTTGVGKRRAWFFSSYLYIATLKRKKRGETLKNSNSYNFYQEINNDGTQLIKDYRHSIKTGVPRDPIPNMATHERTDEMIEHSIKTSVSRTRQEIYRKIRNNDFDLFVTLTVNPNICDRYNDDEVMKKLKNLFDQLRRSDKEFAYICIPERHKDGALHFHMLCSKHSALDLIDTQNKDQSGRLIYRTPFFNRLGRNTITLVDNQESAKKYITKYITKTSLEMNKFKKRYYSSRNLKKPIQRKLMLSDDDKKIVLSTLACDYEVVSAKTIPVPKMNNTINLFNIVPL